jgi:MSHA pilin protein MshB
MLLHCFRRARLRPARVFGRLPQRGRSRGFTLVELTAVMVILGVLSASAVPRFIDLAGQAHAAVVEHTADALSAGLTIALASCALRSWADQDNLSGYADGVVDFNANCYPTDTSGANNIGNNDARCLRVWNAILSAAPTITTAASGADFKSSGQSDVCTYLYLVDDSATRDITYNSLTGAVETHNP